MLTNDIQSNHTLEKPGAQKSNTTEETVMTFSCGDAIKVMIAVFTHVWVRTS